MSRTKHLVPVRRPKTLSQRGRHLTVPKLLETPVKVGLQVTVKRNLGVLGSGPSPLGLVPLYLLEPTYRSLCTHPRDGEVGHTQESRHPPSLGRSAHVVRV